MAWGSIQEASTLYSLMHAFPQSQLLECGLFQIDPSFLPQAWGFRNGDLPPLGASPDGMFIHPSKPDMESNIVGSQVRILCVLSFLYFIFCFMTHKITTQDCRQKAYKTVHKSKASRVLAIQERQKTFDAVHLALTSLHRSYTPQDPLHPTFPWLHQANALSGTMCRRCTSRSGQSFLLDWIKKLPQVN